MQHVIYSKDRGFADHGWLKSHHTFSFANYYNSDMMNYGPLRVINDDLIDAGYGFGSHPHNNMEILSYVLEGELSHKDSMGNGSTIIPGDIQLMSAGTGVVHSEYNHSNKRVRLLQIWIIPNVNNEAPGYQQRKISDNNGKFSLIASPDGQDNSLSIKQDIRIYSGKFNKNESFVSENKGKNYIHVATGNVVINGETLKDGDAIIIENEHIHLTGIDSSEVIWFNIV